jgi:hypothetical protein
MKRLRIFFQIVCTNILFCTNALENINFSKQGDEEKYLEVKEKNFIELKKTA